MPETKSILDHVYDHEQAHADRVFLTQPYDGGKTLDYTWAEVVDQARRMAAHLRSRGIGDGAHVAILSKNCAHFFIAELAIWMAGGTTVAIFPTEGQDTIRFVLEHSDSKLLFVGKLDTWGQQEPGVPEGMPCIAFPLAPATRHAQWDEIVARTEPLAGRRARGADELAMIIYTSGSTGTPKGVMHSFGRVSVCAERICESERYSERDRLISYLPLAHVFERSFVEAASFVASPHVYFSESLETFVTDVRRARPTLFISVPRLWVKFQQGVLHKMPPVTRTVCLEFFGQVREAVPAIVEITDYFKPGGAGNAAGVLLAGLEHLDERYVKAVGYATKAKRHGRQHEVA